MRAALLVTLCTPSRATRPVAGRSGGTPWARRPARRYERRRPEKTPLHKIISENLESWLEWREAAERPVPGYVEEELRGYLECGILCFGFARARCTGCGQGFVVAFSCKGRGVCPSCNGRHMAQTAAHLADHVIPPVPVRQWVISVPKRLRGMLADRPRPSPPSRRSFLTRSSDCSAAAAGVMSDAATPASARPRLGGISFLHRFGSALNHHVHLHACVTDGVFVPAADQAGSDAPPTFLPARPITPADLAALTERVRRRVIRWFRMQRLLDAAAAADMLAWENSGFSVDASVRITLIDRDVPSYFRSLEHLLRILRPAPVRPRATLRDPRRQTAGSPASATCCPGTRPPTGSGPAAAASPRGRGPTASSNSRRLSFWTGWPISSRRRGSTGIAITGCLPRITSSGPPSRRSRSGTSASDARPRPAGMGATVMPRKAAATRLSKAPLARHLTDCLGETHGPGGGGVSARVPELWRRHPADRVHHGAGADSEDPDTSWRTARTSARLARPGPADRLGRARAGP